MKLIFLFKLPKNLKTFLSFSGKILSRPNTKLKSKGQRVLKKAIKTARIMGFLPFSKRHKNSELYA